MKGVYIKWKEFQISCNQRQNLSYLLWVDFISDCIRKQQQKEKKKNRFIPFYSSAILNFRFYSFFAICVKIYKRENHLSLARQLWNNNWWFGFQFEYEVWTKRSKKLLMSVIFIQHPKYILLHTYFYRLNLSS